MWRFPIGLPPNRLPPGQPQNRLPPAISTPNCRPPSPETFFFIYRSVLPSRDSPPDQRIAALFFNQNLNSAVQKLSAQNPWICFEMWYVRDAPAQLLSPSPQKNIWSAGSASVNFCIIERSILATTTVVVRALLFDNLFYECHDDSTPFTLEFKKLKSEFKKIKSEFKNRKSKFKNLNIKFKNVTCELKKLK